MYKPTLTGKFSKNLEIAIVGYYLQDRFEEFKIIEKCLFSSFDAHFYCSAKLRYLAKIESKLVCARGW